MSMKLYPWLLHLIPSELYAEIPTRSAKTVVVSALTKEKMNELFRICCKQEIPDEGAHQAYMDICKATKLAPTIRVRWEARNPENNPSTVASTRLRDYRYMKIDYPSEWKERIAYEIRQAKQAIKQKALAHPDRVYRIGMDSYDRMAGSIQGEL